ncbi:MAG: hypothetical protein ACKV2V_08735, partial [Blastocatellia bacterium]
MSGACPVRTGLWQYNIVLLWRMITVLRFTGPTQKMFSAYFSRISRRNLFAIIALLILLFALTLTPVSSHEPITTSVTFNKEVARILQRSCWECHGRQSLVGIPLTTYEEARPWAKAIKEEVLEKRMPPFQAVRGFGSFANSYALTQRETELLISWIEGGAPRGNEKDLPPDTPVWPLGKPDAILELPDAAQTPAVETGPDEETQCLRIPAGLDKNQLIRGVGFAPGNISAVSGITITIANEKTKGDCVAGTVIGQWLPGAGAQLLPADLGQMTPAGATLSVQLRYRKGMAAAAGRARRGLYFAAGAGALQAREVAIQAPETMIPANAARHRVRATYTVRQAAEALFIRPLLYPLATSVEAIARRPDGTAEALIVAEGYRYPWQPAYQFRAPVALPAGTRIEVTAWLDNSEDNARL